MAQATEQAATTLAGRGSELASLAALLDKAAAGEARSVVVLGAAGVGKTALVNAAVASRADAAVLTGRCLPLVSVALPFLAIRDVLRGARRLNPPDLDGVVGSGADLTRVDEWVTRLSDQSPVVLVIDDLQWADQGTLDVLAYLIAGPPGRRLAVMATIREEELHDGHPLQRWLVRLRRLPRVAEHRIDRLDRAATAEQMATVMGGSPHQSLIDEVFGKSQGNPYLTRLLIERLPLETRRLDDHLPADLATAVSHAWSVVGDRTRQAATALAIGGSPRRPGDVAVVLGEPDFEVDSALRTAVDAGLLQSANDGSLWFRHPMDAEVLENRLPHRDRADLHASYAKHLSEASIGESGWLAGAIADHWLRSGDSAQARVSASTAAEEAERSGAWPDVVRVLSQAVSLPSGQELDRGMLARLRSAAENAGLLRVELDAVESLLALPATQADAASAAELLVRRSLLRFWTGRQNHSLSDAQAAAQVAASAPATAGHAIAMAYLAANELDVGDSDAASHAELALAEARALREDRALSWALVANSNVAIAEGEASRAVAYAVEAADVALRCRSWIAFVAAVSCEVNAQDALSSPTVIACLGRRREQLISAGAPHMHIGFLATAEADGLMVTGAWKDCQDRLRDVFVADPGSMPDALARLTAARLAAWQGRQDDAEQHLARVEELLDVTEMFEALSLPTVRAEVRLGAGDALGAYEAAMAGLRFERLPPDLCEWLLPLASRALADLAQDARDNGRDPAEQVAALLELVHAHPQTIRYPGMSGPTMRREYEALDVLYAAEVARGDVAEGQSGKWNAAANALISAQLPWEGSYARYREAEALLIRDIDRRRGADALRDALSLSVRLQAGPLEGAVRSLARRARVTLAEPAAHVTLKSGVPLTARERDVLSLVVAGRTYGEIARELFISEKTVSTHVSHLLAKTGTANRVELAGLAERAGVVADA